MADVLGAVSAVAGLLELSIRLAERATKAYQGAKEISGVLTQHQAELERVKSTVELIRDEEALRTANVTQELLHMEGIAQRLNEALGDMGRKRSIVRQFFYQLVHGEKDQEVLAGLMREMNRSNVALTLFVSVAHVGVSLAMGKGLVADRRAVERIDQTLRDLLGQGKGLKIAGLVNSRSSVDADTVSITEADLIEMDKIAIPPSGEEEEREKSKEQGISVMVNRNFALDQSLMINGAVGQHDWIVGSKIKLSVTDNKTSGQATMLAGVISDEALARMFEARRAK